MGNVIIADKLKKESETIDMNGNIINPITKEILKKADEE